MDNIKKYLIIIADCETYKKVDENLRKSPVKKELSYLIDNRDENITWIAIDYNPRTNSESGLKECVNRIISQYAKGREVLLFIRHKPYYCPSGCKFCWILTGTEGDALRDELIKSWKKRKISEKILRKIIISTSQEIVSSFLPLHLSLQAFFGISRDESGNWVRIGKDKNYVDRLNIGVKVLEQAGIKEAKDIDDEFKKHFPNTDAFLLVEEAEWDFYASMFDKVMPNCEGMKNDCKPNCDEEEEEYTKDRKISVLLEYFIENTELEENKKKQLKILKEAFEQEYRKEANALGAKGGWFEVNGQPVSYAKFVKTLREVCAILANTDDNCKRNDDETFIYKGSEKCLEERNKILKNIWNKNEAELNETRHCKLQKSDLYDRLKEQLKAWGKGDNFKKLKIVIQGVEELAKCVEKAL